MEPGSRADASGWTTTRRGFLRLAGTSAAFTVLAQLRPLAPSAAAALPHREGRFFDAIQTEILTQIMERVVDSGVPDAPRVRDTGAVTEVTGFLLAA